MKENEESNIIKIGNSAIVLSISKFVVLFITLIITMIFSRTLSLVEFGTYSQLLLIVNLSVTFFSFGLTSSVTYFLSSFESQIEKERFISTYYFLITCLSIMAGIILVLTLPFMEIYFKNNLLRSFFYVVFLFPWIKLITISLDNFLVVLKKPFTLMKFKIFNIFSILIIAILTSFFDFELQFYMSFMILIQSFFALFSYFLINKNIKIKFSSIRKEMVMKIFKFSIPIGLASAVGALSVQLDKFIIGGFFSTEELAIYSNAARELPISIIAVSLTTTLMPYMVKLLKNKCNVEAVKLWNETTIFSFLIISFLVIFIFVNAETVISFLYSSKYLTGIAVFRVYTLVILMRCTYFGIVLNSLGETRFILYSSLGALILNVFLNFIFYYLFGFVGPSIATLISTICIALLQLYVTSKKINYKFSKIFPWKKICEILLINVLLGIGFSFVKELLCFHQVIEFIFVSVIWVFLYFLIIKNELITKWNLMNRKG